MNALESFADAIMHHEGWTAGSVSNRNRNPGNLEHSSDGTGWKKGDKIVFESLVTGYMALLGDLRLKFLGKSRTGIGPASTLAEFFQAWAPASDHNDPLAYARDVAQWVSTATGKVVTPSTRLRDIWQGQ